VTATSRLVAILAVDVIGYSRVMGEDKAGMGRNPARLHSRSPGGVVRHTLGTYTGRRQGPLGVRAAKKSGRGKYASLAPNFQRQINSRP